VWMRGYRFICCRCKSSHPCSSENAVWMTWGAALLSGIGVWAVLGGPSLLAAQEWVLSLGSETRWTQSLASALYGIGAVGLLVLIVLWFYRQQAFVSFPPPVAGFVYRCSLAGLLYVIDFWASTAREFDFSRRYWGFLPLCAFFAAGLLLKGN
jgi:hypothetical protein